jgi:hypothetical protein
VPFESGQIIAGGSPLVNWRRAEESPEAGKLADLALFEGDLLKEFASLRRI